MRESKLQRDCLAWVRDLGPSYLAVNIHGGGWGQKGFPDLMIMHAGRVVFVELKSDSGYKLQPDQQVWRERLTRAGMPWHLVRTLGQFKTIVKEEL